MIVGPGFGGFVSILTAEMSRVSGLLALALIAILAIGCNGSTNGQENDSAPTNEPQSRSETPTPGTVANLPSRPASTVYRDGSTATPAPVGSVNEPVTQTARRSTTTTRTLPTPTLHREWYVREIIVNGGTVTVYLHMYAAVDVRVGLGGREPDQVDWADGTLQHVFHDVPAGRQEFVVSDVMGFSEVIEVVVRGSHSGR